MELPVSPRVEGFRADKVVVNAKKFEKPFAGLAGS